MEVPQSNEVGVNWSKSSGKWCATLKRDGKLRHIGLYDDIQSAVVAREAAIHEYNEELKYRVYKQILLDDLEEMISLLSDLASDVELGLEHEYPKSDRDKYPSYQRRYDNDMEIVTRANGFVYKYTT